MEKENCFYLGRITKVIGFKGEVVVFIDSDEPEKYHALDALFVDMRGNLIPFFVEKISMRNKNNQVTIKFQDIDDHEDAGRLQGCEVFLPLDLLPPLEGNAFYFHEVEEFDVYDKAKGHIGRIDKVLDYPANPLFEVVYKDKLLLIPVQDRFIEKVDREKKEIHINAPEGLIDMYLDE